MGCNDSRWARRELAVFPSCRISQQPPVRWQDIAMAPIFALMAAAVSAYVSLGIALAGGIPIFYVLRRRGLTSVRAYLFAGAALHDIPI